MANQLHKSNAKCYTCQLFLSEKREVFFLIVTGTSENFRATSEDLLRFSEDFRTLPKMSEDIPTTFKHLRYERIVDI